MLWHRTRLLELQVRPLHTVLLREDGVFDGEELSQLEDYTMQVATLHTDGNPKDEPEVLIP
jgi:hypothetical protein